MLILPRMAVFVAWQTPGRLLTNYRLNRQIPFRKGAVSQRSDAGERVERKQHALRYLSGNEQRIRRVQVRRVG